MNLCAYHAQLLCCVPYVTVLGELGMSEEVVTVSTPQYGPCGAEELRARMSRAVASLGRTEAGPSPPPTSHLTLSRFCH